MALMIVGVVGRDDGRIAGHHLPVGSHEELLEVPPDVAVVAFGVGGLGELVVERMAARRRSPRASRTAGT